MNICKIKEIIKNNNGVITSKQVSENNIDSWYLTNMVKKGMLKRVSRGVYFDEAYENFDELFFLQAKNKICIYSYQSALYLHGLTERLPFIEEVTVYQGYNTWRIKNKVKVHQVKKQWYKVGVTTIKSSMGNPIIAYDMERTICDLIRDRKNQDVEIFSKAINNYFKSESKNLLKLREYSKIFGITKKIEDIIEVVLY